MVDIVLYGVPEGFSILPGFEREETFFQTFYRDLKGKDNDELLDIRNRKDRIVYSYLRYNFKDKNGRENSFFGFSLVLREGVYEDVVSIFTLMKRVYDEKIKDSAILTDNESGKFFKIKNFGEINKEILSNIKSAIEPELDHQNIVKNFSSDTQDKQVLISNIKGLESKEGLNKRLYYYVKKYANIYLRGEVLENVINEKDYVPNPEEQGTAVFVSEYLSEGELESLTQRLISSCKDIESFYRDQSKIGSTETYSTADKPTLQYYTSSIKDLLKKINSVETDINRIIPKLRFYSRADIVGTFKGNLDKLKEYSQDLKNKEILILSKFTPPPPDPPDDNFFKQNKKIVLGIIGVFIIIVLVLVIKTGKNTTTGESETITASVEEDKEKEESMISQVEESISNISSPKKEEKVEVKEETSQKTKEKKQQKKEEALQDGDLSISYIADRATVTITEVGKNRGVKKEEVKKGHWVVNGEDKGSDSSLECSDIQPKKDSGGMLDISYVNEKGTTIVSTTVHKTNTNKNKNKYKKRGN